MVTWYCNDIADKATHLGVIYQPLTHHSYEWKFILLKPESYHPLLQIQKFFIPSWNFLLVQYLVADCFIWIVNLFKILV
jgi:hypothetical protein